MVTNRKELLRVVEFYTELYKSRQKSDERQTENSGKRVLTKDRKNCRIYKRMK